MPVHALQLLVIGCDLPRGLTRCTPHRALWKTLSFLARWRRDVRSRGRFPTPGIHSRRRASETKRASAASVSVAGSGTEINAVPPEKVNAEWLVGVPEPVEFDT
jgi:hypothetical protein